MICDTVGGGTERSVIFCAFLWMYSGLLRAHGERARQTDPWNAFARGPWWQVFDFSLGAHRLRTPN